MPGSNKTGFAIYGERRVAANVRTFVGRKVEAGVLATGLAAHKAAKLADLYAPRDTGALARSIEVVEIGEGESGAGRDIATGRFRQKPLGFRVTVGGDNVNPKSGQPTSSYAAAVHETHRRKSKFLERAVVNVARFFGRDIARAMRAAG